MHVNVLIGLRWGKSARPCRQCCQIGQFMPLNLTTFYDVQAEWVIFPPNLTTFNHVRLEKWALWRISTAGWGFGSVCKGAALVAFPLPKVGVTRTDPDWAVLVSQYDTVEVLRRLKGSRQVWDSHAVRWLDWLSVTNPAYHYIYVVLKRLNVNVFWRQKKEKFSLNLVKRATILLNLQRELSGWSGLVGKILKYFLQRKQHNYHNFQHKN